MLNTPRRAFSALLLFFPAVAVAQPCEPAWDPLQDKSTADGAVRALVFHESENAAYAAGAFTSMAGEPAPFVAKFDGDAWVSLGDGFDDAAFALAEHQGAIFAGGKFTSSGAAVLNRIAQWNGAQWAPLGAGLGGDVLALASFHDGNSERLYAAGTFLTAGGAGAAGIAQWNGATWTALATGLQGGAKTGVALQPHNDGAGEAIFVGGSFLGAGGQPSANIVKWNGAAWSAVGAGLNGIVRALAEYEGDLIAGGDFTMSGAAAAVHLARWNGTTWTTFAGGANGPVHTISTIDSAQGAQLVVGGEFTTIGGQPANRIAIFDGDAWSALGDGLTSVARATAPYDNALLVGANATTPGGSSTTPLRRWELCDAAIVGDLNGDGMVNGADLAQLLSLWGADIPEDLSGDDVINGADLAALLSNWT